MNGTQFFQKELSVYDYTILFDTAAEGEKIYSDPNNEFISDYNLKTLNNRLLALENDPADIATGELRAKRVGDKVYIGMPYSAANEAVDQVNVFRNSLSDQANNNVNFEQEYYIPKGTELTSAGTLIKDSGDDIAPPNINGSYIGANHGWNQPRRITKTNHGKTFADIGKTATDGNGTVFTIIQIIDANSFVLCSVNAAVDGFSYTFAAPVGGTLTFPEGSFTGYTDASMGNTMEFTKSLQRSVLINGVDPLADGSEKKANFIDIIDSYDVYDLSTTVTKIMQNAGNYTSNPDFTSIGADKFFRMDIIYRYTGNNCLTTHNFLSYKKMNVSFLPFIQMSAMGTGSKLYVNKLLPISDGVKTYDFRKGEAWDVAPATSLTFAKNKWESPTNAPDRFVLYMPNFAVASGFIKDKGWQRENNTDAGWLYTSRKVYPYGVNGVGVIEANTFFSAQTFRSYQSREEYPAGRISKVGIYDQYGEYYLMLDWNASLTDVVTLPKEVFGKKITIVEKTANVTMFGDIATSQLLIKVVVDVTNLYGYLVLKIT